MGCLGCRAHRSKLFECDAARLVLVHSEKEPMVRWRACSRVQGTYARLTQGCGACITSAHLTFAVLQTRGRAQTMAAAGTTGGTTAGTAAGTTGDSIEIELLAAYHC